MEPLEEWLTRLENKTSSEKYALLLLGKTGSGRTTLVESFFKQHHYFLHTINTQTCHNKQFLTEVLQKIIHHRHHYFFDPSIKHALLIDDLEGVTSTEKGSMSDIIEMIQTASEQAQTINVYPVPIICISDDHYLKKKNNLSKLCHVVHMSGPSLHTLHSIILDWAKENNKKLSKSVLQLLITLSKHDIYRLKNMLLYLSLADIPKLSKQKVTTILQDFTFQQKHMHLFTATEKLFTEPVTMEESLFYYTKEPTLLPLMIHENAIHHIKKPSKRETDSLEQHQLQVMRTLSHSMMTEHQLYHRNEWDLHLMYGAQSCYLVTHKLRKFSKTTKPSLRYTLLLNKVSLKHTYLHKYRDIMEKNQNNDLYFDKETVRIMARQEPQRWTKKVSSDLLKMT